MGVYSKRRNTNGSVGNKNQSAQMPVSRAAKNKK